jgi:hypothetical protein
MFIRSSCLSKNKTAFHAVMDIYPGGAFSSCRLLHYWHGLVTGPFPRKTVCGPTDEVMDSLRQ